MVVLDLLEVSEARKTLGVMMVPNCNSTAEYERLLGESQKWASQVKAGNLQNIDAWLALRSTISKTLEYPLNATTLTQHRCTRISRPALEAGLTHSPIFNSTSFFLIALSLNYVSQRRVTEC
jgi:hypothetical protein